VSVLGELRGLLRNRRFARLYAVRLTSQAADGVFQASLAAAVLFNPDRQTDATAAAISFVIVLLPYSLVGPFVGVFIDRWSRQRVLVRANLIRAGLLVFLAAFVGWHGPTGPLFYLTALCALSVNRFLLAALSAALPHVVEVGQLVTANSVSTTSGSVATAAGAALALGLRSLAGRGDRGSALTALAAAVVYVVSAGLARAFDRRLLGPDAQTLAPAVRHAFAAVLVGFTEGARHLRRRRDATAAMLAVTSHRLYYGLSTVATLLLYRNYFHDHGFYRAGLGGLAQVVVAIAIGTIAAAVLTPPLVARIGKPACIVSVFAMASGVELAFGLPYTQPSFLIAGVFLGLAAQASKICVDTILQERIDDRFRGRVFSLYDMAFNAAFVLAAVIGAFTLPRSGKSYPVLGGIAAGYALTALGYGWFVRRESVRGGAGPDHAEVTAARAATSAPASATPGAIRSPS